MFVKSIMKPPHECKCAQKHDSLNFNYSKKLLGEIGKLITATH